MDAAYWQSQLERHTDSGRIDAENDSIPSRPTWPTEGLRVTWGGDKGAVRECTDRVWPEPLLYRHGKEVAAEGDMPSKARQAFDANVKDVDRLLELHRQIGGAGKGRRYGLEVLNKSAVVLITAFWEAYCEDLAAEGLAHLVKEAPSADALPKSLKKQIAKELKEDVNQIAVWEISDGKWRGYLTQRLTKLQDQRNWSLNTPKSAQLDDLFESAVGIEHISDAWTVSNKTGPDQARKKLDAFVGLRGNVAHRGAHDGGVKRKDVVDYFTLVKSLAGKTGGRVNSHVKGITGKALY